MAAKTTAKPLPPRSRPSRFATSARAFPRRTSCPRSRSTPCSRTWSSTITKHLKKGARIRIGGLGILQVRKRAARMGRNPATGEPIKIKASKKVAFRAAKELKESV